MAMATPTPSQPKPGDEALPGQSGRSTDDGTLGSPRNLEAILRIPVVVQAILGTATMPVANLMKLGRGAIVPLDHRIGEPVDIVVNGRVVARGEVVVLEEDSSRFGVTLTEVAGLPGSGAA
jgi:flagellar motor switch protein FliN/FliY